MSDPTHKDQDDANRAGAAPILFDHSPTAEALFTSRHTLTAPYSFYQNSPNLAPPNSAVHSRAVSPALSQGSVASNNSNNAAHQSALASRQQWDQHQVALNNENTVHAHNSTQASQAYRHEQSIAPRTVPLLSHQTLQSSSEPQASAGYIAYANEIHQAATYYTAPTERLSPASSVARALSVTASTVYTPKLETRLAGIMAGNPMINSVKVITKLAEFNEGLASMIDDRDGYIRRLQTDQAQYQASQAKVLKQTVNKAVEKAVKEAIRPLPKPTEQQNADLIARDQKIKAMEEFIKDQAGRVAESDIARDRALLIQREQEKRLTAAETALNVAETARTVAEDERDVLQRRYTELDRAYINMLVMAVPILPAPIQDPNDAGGEQPLFGTLEDFDWGGYGPPQNQSPGLTQGQSSNLNNSADFVTPQTQAQNHNQGQCPRLNNSADFGTPQNQAQDHTQGQGLYPNNSVDSGPSSAFSEGEDEGRDEEVHPKQEQDQDMGGFDGLQHVPDFDQAASDARSLSVRAPRSVYDLSPPRFDLYARPQGLKHQQEMNKQLLMIEANASAAQQLMMQANVNVAQQGFVGQQGFINQQSFGGQQSFSGQQGMGHQQLMMRQHTNGNGGHPGFGGQQAMNAQHGMMQQQGHYNAGQQGFGGQHVNNAQHGMMQQQRLPQMFGSNGMEDPFYAPPVPPMYTLGSTHTPGRQQRPTAPQTPGRRQQVLTGMQSPTRNPSTMRAPNSAPNVRRRHKKHANTRSGASTKPGEEGKMITLDELRDTMRKEHDAKRQQRKLANAKKQGFQTSF